MTKTPLLIVAFCLSLGLGCASDSTISCFETATGEVVCIEGYSTNDADVDGDGVTDTFVCADSEDDGDDDGDVDDDGIDDDADADDDDDGIDDSEDADDDDDGIEDDIDCDDMDDDDGDDDEADDEADA